MSVTRSSVRKFTPRPPGWKRCHQIPSITTTPGRVASVTRALKVAVPRALSTHTWSPSAMSRAEASAGASITVGLPCRRRSRSDWLNDEFRKKRLGGTMHCSG